MGYDLETNALKDRILDLSFANTPQIEWTDQMWAIASKNLSDEYTIHVSGFLDPAKVVACVRKNLE